MSKSTVVKLSVDSARRDNALLSVLSAGGASMPALRKRSSSRTAIDDSRCAASPQPMPSESSRQSVPSSVSKWAALSPLTRSPRLGRSERPIS